MLNHFGRFGENAIVSQELGHSIGIGGYLKAITPGVNMYYAYQDVEEACH
jgi:hypothetical protein